MRHILIIFSIFLFSFTIISCAKKSSSDGGSSTTTPVLAEVTPVPNQISNSVPEYTFSSTMNGHIHYPQPETSVAPQDDWEGNWSPITCWTGRNSNKGGAIYNATSGDNTIYLYPNSLVWDEELEDYKSITLYDGTYSNYCKLTIYSSTTGAEYADWKGSETSGAWSNILTVSPFTIGSGVFVAVGNSGNIVRSTDNGTTWDNATSPTANDLNGITYGNNIAQNWHKGNYVAVGSSGNIVKSADSTNCKTNWSGSNSGVSPQDEGVICDIGSSFDNKTSPTASHLIRVTFGNNTFVAVGGSGNIVRSDAGGSYYAHNLISFDNVTSPITSNLRGITFGNNIFVAVGRYGKIVRSSDNGTSFDNATSTTANTLRRITFGNNTFVAVGNGGNIVRSTDNGSSFDNATSPTTNDLYDVGFGNNTFVAVGTNGNIFRSTDDGITWDNATSPTSNNLNGITYGNYSFVAVGDGGNIVRSTDYGSTWDNITSGTSNNLNGVGF